MRTTLTLCLACIAGIAYAQEVPEPAVELEYKPEEVQTESKPEEIFVTGEYPGPGLWKVRRADDPEDHVMWILGTPPPVPKKLKWKSTEVEAIVQRSQEVLLPSSIDVQPDERIGIFKGLTLLPAALGARKNPGDTTLKELLAPETHARWLVLKKKFLGRNDSIERWRPIFAAFELLNEAFDDSGLRESSIVTPVVTKIAEKNKIKTTTPRLEFTIKTKDIRAKIKEFAKEPLADAECFTTTLDLVEAISDRESMQARANAWAIGDLQTLAAFEPLPNPSIACEAAVMGSQIAQELVPSDIRTQLRQLWIEAAEKSLAANQSTFALLSITDLTRPEGLLAALRTKGYVVEAPDRD